MKEMKCVCELGQAERTNGADMRNEVDDLMDEGSCLGCEKRQNEGRKGEWLRK